jgi:DNA-binding NtrC family response regulator
MMSDIPIVAVFNASEDTVDMLIAFFRQLGMNAVGEPWPARQPLSLEVVQGFVLRHRPHVIVFDVSFPYDHNWARYCEFRVADSVRKLPVVLTTTNKRALEAMVGPAEALEIIGKPYDLNDLADAVHRALSQQTR